MALSVIAHSIEQKLQTLIGKSQYVATQQCQRRRQLCISKNFFSMNTDWTTNPKTLFVSTDKRVYSSHDNGDSWQSTSQGLPRRLHCADLRLVVDPSGKHYLYLSTFGWSVSQTALA